MVCSDTPRRGCGKMTKIEFLHKISPSKSSGRGRRACLEFPGYREQGLPLSITMFHKHFCQIEICTSNNIKFEITIAPSAFKFLTFFQGDCLQKFTP